MAIDGGYLKVYRRIVWEVDAGGDPLWNERRVWGRAEAWMYLMLTAAYAPHDRCFKGGKVVHLERGEFYASLRFLARKWGWGKDKVAKFLRILESDLGRILRKNTDTTADTYLIVNYEAYQGSADGEQTRSRQRADREQTKDKKVKKVKKVEETEEERRGVPPALSAPEFVATWLEFVEWRRVELRKPMTDKARELMLKKLAKLGSVAWATAALRLSMANDWQGVVPERVPDAEREDEAPPPQPRADGFEHFVTGDLWSAAEQRWVDRAEWLAARTQKGLS